MSELPSFNVLCVDDHSDSRLAICLILEYAGYRVSQASSGHEALLLAPKADLVILDVGLPDINGLEVCRQLKAAPATALVPVILLSGHFTRSVEKAEGLEGGGDVYLTKPVDARELLGQVKALLRIRQAELLLQHQAEIIDQIHDAVIATDRRGHVTRWNRGAERMFGYTAAEMLDQSVSRLDPTSNPVGVRFGDLLPIVSEKGSHELEMRVRRKSGAEFFIHLSLSRLQDHQGEEAGAISYSSDISERKQLEEQYRQALKMEAVGKLAGGIGHEFNNLMTAVIGFSQILLEGLPEQDPQRLFVSEVLKAGNRAVVLTRQLLSYCRKAMVQPIRLELNALVLRHEEQFRQLGAHGIEIVVDLDPNLGQVVADPVQMEEAIRHLTANARDAMPQGGRLTLRTQKVNLDKINGDDIRLGCYAMLEVTDSGTGMTKETLAHLFEPFFTTKEVGKGTGLGLASVYGSVKQAHGHMDISSEPGSGTKVTIYLPLLQEPTPVSKARAETRRTTADTKTVLLVQDDDGARGLTRYILTSQGYKVVETGNGAAALEVGIQHDGWIDLLITNLFLPGMEGTQLARRLQAQHPEMKTLYLSSYSEEAGSALTVAERGNFLEKPYSKDAFVNKVRELLAQTPEN